MNTESSDRPRRRAQDLLTHFCSRAIRSEERLDDYLTAAVAGVLADRLRTIAAAPPEAAPDPLVFDVAAFDPREYSGHADASYFRPLLELAQRARQMTGDILGAYLHGSLATMDYVKGYSDVDLWVVIRDEAAADGQRLLALRRELMSWWPLLRAIDPLQHHGVMVATEADLRGYPLDGLPPAVLPHMKCLAGGTRLAVRPRPAPADFTALLGRLDGIIRCAPAGRLEHHAFGGEYLLGRFRNAENAMYQLKYYLGQFLLLPALYLAGRGEGCYKRESFAKVRGEWPADVLAWIDRISDLRRQWGEREGAAYRPNAVPGWLREELGAEYLENGAACARRLKQWITRRHDHPDRRLTAGV